MRASMSITSGSATGLTIVRVACWFCGFFPFCYYVALAVICGIHHYWISVGLAVAVAAVLLLWLTLNGIALFSALHLGLRSRAAAAAQKREPSDSHDAEARQQHRDAALPTFNPHVGLLTTDVRSDVANEAGLPQQREAEVDGRGEAGEGEINEVDLSSIHHSMDTAPERAFNEMSISSVNAAANPFSAKSATSNRSHRGTTVHAQPARTGRHAEGDEGDDTTILSPPAGTRPSTAVAPAINSATTATQPYIPNAYDARQSRSNSNSDDSDVHFGRMTKEKNGSITSATTKPPQTASTAGPQSPSTQLLAASTNATPVITSSVAVGAAFMMPYVTIYITLLLSPLILAASFLFEFDTHCLMLALPALTVPCLWATLIPLTPFFNAHSSLAYSFHARLLRVLTHWAFLLFVCAVGIGVYVAALTMETVSWVPYRRDSEAVSRGVRVASYITPIPTFIIVFIFVVNASIVSGEVMVIAEPEQEALMHEEVNKPRAELHVGSPSSLTQPPSVTATRGPLQPAFGQLGSFGNRSHLSQSPPAASLQQQNYRLASIAPRHSMQTESDELSSILSSIVRSSTTSSVFIPSSALASPTKLSVSKSLLRGSRTSSNGSSAPHAVVPSAHMASMPQLKTVTMLYIAYRNIYDEDDDAFGAGLAGSGMAANRNMQQTISTNFEAMMEALEDAREEGKSDANAYVLTAYEDALCLVWGLMPFSSEPVLLALEKARDIMEAFKSHPKPPPSSPNDQQELVAAVVSAPHSLVGLIGTDHHRGIHFFNPHQHDAGAQLMQRGLAMYRRLPSVQSSAAGTAESPFTGILMDSRSWHCTASSVLSRPCGVRDRPPLRKRLTQANSLRPPIGISTKPASRQYPIMYNFVDFVQAKEEEWHLVVQRQEQLGAKFGFLSEAAQLLQQGDPKGARSVLTNAVQHAGITTDADNIALAQLLIEDLNEIEGKAS